MVQLDFEKDKKWGRNWEKNREIITSWEIERERKKEIESDYYAMMLHDLNILVSNFSIPRWSTYKGAPTIKLDKIVKW